MIRFAQNMLAAAKSKSPYVIPPTNEAWWREYYASMGRILILEWSALYDGRDLSEPTLGSMALKPCSAPDCRRSVPVDAWRLWRARRRGVAVALMCDDHAELPEERAAPPMLQPERDTDRQLAEIVRLDVKLLKLDAFHPWMAAYAKVGLFERDRLDWTRAQLNVRDDLGDGADAAIAAARAAAGTAVYFVEGYTGDEGPPFVVPVPRERDTWGCSSDDDVGPDGPPPTPPPERRPDPRAEPKPEPVPEPIPDFIF